jgi:aspartate aminotransferase-like enzyme
MTVQPNDVNLRVPGPTPVPEAVARAGARPMVNHRGPEFAAVLDEVAHGLQPYFGTGTLPLLLTGSGTGGQEAAIVNVLSPGDDVLAVTVGVFGDRFAAIAEAFGATVHRLTADWGTAIAPDAVAEAVSRLPALRAVLLTHNETSTGVTNDIAAIARAIQTAVAVNPPLILVDGVSSIGALPFAMDAWGVDVAVTGSQKAWMSPPGIAMIALSERAWQAHRTARMPRFYWDFTKARKNAEKRTTPFTPAVGVIHALQEALRLMTRETSPAIFARHRRIAERLRTGLTALGLELFADPAVASNTVTAVRIPTDFDGKAFTRDLRRQGVVVGGGQDWLAGSIFRVGHMGHVHEDDIDRVLAAIRATLASGEEQLAVNS